MSQLQDTTDVAVIGAGVIGLSVAWRAAQRGLRVTVLDRGEPGGGTSDVAAGMIAAIAEVEFAEHGAMLGLRLDGARRWPAWAAELRELTGLDPGYRRCGTLVLARDADAAEELDRELALRRELGLPVERLLPSQARRREPAIAPLLRAALDVPDDHAIDPRALCAALVVAVRRCGGLVMPGAEVLGVRPHAVELAGGRRLAAEHVVVAAGVWSGALVGAPVRPVKGQLLTLRDPAGPGLVERVLRLEPGYLVPRGDGRYVLGATVEERGFDTTVTVGAIHDLLRDAAELVPGLLELELIEALAGLRPGTPDNAPLIGPAETPGVVYATGHHRNGILLAPTTGDLVASALAGEDWDPLLAPFAPDRFAGAMA